MRVLPARFIFFGLGVLILTGCSVDGLCLVDYPRGSITVVDGSRINDGETFTIHTGGGTYIYEFDLNDSYDLGNTRRFIYSDADTADQIRDAIISEVNYSVFPVSASSGGPGLVKLVYELPGGEGNMPLEETVVDPDFVVEGMAGGCPTLTPPELPGPSLP